MRRMLQACLSFKWTQKTNTTRWFKRSEKKAFDIKLSGTPKAIRESKNKSLFCLDGASFNFHGNRSERFEINLLFTARVNRQRAFQHPAPELAGILNRNGKSGKKAAKYLFKSKMTADEKSSKWRIFIYLHKYFATRINFFSMVNSSLLFTWKSLSEKRFPQWHAIYLHTAINPKSINQLFK